MYPNMAQWFRRWTLESGTQDWKIPARSVTLVALLSQDAVSHGANSTSSCPSSLPAIRLKGPEDPLLRNSRFLRSHDLAHASIPLAQTPWGLTGRAWLQAGAQQVVIVVVPPLKSLGIDSRNAQFTFRVSGMPCSMQVKPGPQPYLICVWQRYSTSINSYGMAM